MTFKPMFLAASLLAAAVSSAGAQTDNPVSGSGPSLGGSVAPFGVPAGGFSGLAGTAGSLSSASGGLRVTNPGTGGSVVVPANVAQSIGGVLSGNPSPAQVATATEAFGGTPAAAALVSALAAMGANPTPGTVTAAIQAYNAAVQALPAGGSPSPGLLAARSVLAGFSR
ncbi:MAG: hypothetical protein FJ361_07150 [Gemmatimonadetes bacterium]|nr:hypothetical protein [Gemmatimonadota bacterium]